MFCSNCGKEIDDRFPFCEYCGAPQKPGSPAQAYQPKYSAPVQKPAPKKEKFPLWIPIVLAGIVVLAAVVTGSFLLFGKKTVYLMTESVTESTTNTNTVRREYDEKGHLISIENTQEYGGDYSYLKDTVREIQYEYDKDGKLICAELEIHGSTGERVSAEVEYLYQKGILEDIKVDHSNEQVEFDLRFTDDGKIKEVTLSESGDESVIYNFRYYDNGRLKSAKMEYLSLDYSSENHYDERGRLTEFNYFRHGNVQVQDKYEYEGESTFFTRYTTITYQDGKEETRQEIIIDPVMDGDILTELNLTFEVEGDGEKHSVQFTGDIEWDGLEGIWEPKIRGDIEDLGDNFLPEELETEIERDEQGHITRFTIFYADMDMRKVVMGVEREYTAVKVPRNYQQPGTADPLYSLIWLN